MATLSDLQTGLLHWWSMDQSSGQRIDHVGGKHLTNNGASATPGIGGRGGAILFDASNNEYLSVTSNGTQSDTLSVGPGEFTINFFIRLDDVLTAQQWILGKSASFGLSGEYDVYWNPPNSITVSWNTDTTTFSVSPNPSAGTVLMLTIYKDNTNAVYGVTVNASSTPAETGVVDQYRTNHDFRIGGFSSGANNLTGAVDEVGFWNRKLSQDELDVLFEFYDGNNYAATYTDITGIPSVPSASDFNDPCGVAIDCCNEILSTYDSLNASNDTPDCPTDVEITFDPPPGGRVNLPGYLVLSTNSPTGTIRYAEFGMEPNAESPAYTGPIEIDSVGGGISAKVFYDDCPPTRSFAVRHRASTTENLRFIFSYFCATADNAGKWGVFTGNGVDDNHWSLVTNASASVTIDRIDVFQLDTDGKWTTGLAWSTTEFIYPYSDPTKYFRALPLVCDDGAQINSDYDTPSPLITYSGAKTIDLYGEQTFPVSGFFKVAIHMSTGKVLYSVISSETCEAGGGPATPCIIPPAPVLTPGCNRITVQFAMTVGHQFRVYAKSDCDELGFILSAEGTVASNPQSVNVSGLTEGCEYQFYVSQWDNSASCDYIDSDIASATPLKDPAGTMTALPALIDSGDDVTVTWSVANVTGVTITSDDGAFTIGAVSSSGSQTFSPGPTADNCWHLTGTNTCGSMVIDACTTIDDSIPASCPDGLETLYTCDEVAANGTYATFGDVTFGTCGGGTTGFPDWNGSLPISATSCIWETQDYAITINDNNRRTRLVATLLLSPSTYWLLRLRCNGNTADLWVGTKSSGATPVGTYTRVSGDYASPATLTIS